MNNKQDEIREVNNRICEKLDAAPFPEHMKKALELYLIHGVPGGGFLTAVLSNDLLESYRRADEVNTPLIPDYVRFLYNVAPFVCWKSKENVEHWLSSGGLQGKIEC